MSLGKILGSISPAFGMLSGQGMFGHMPLQQMGQMGMGGILGMLLSHGGDGGGDQQQQPQQQTDISSAYPGIDPMLTQGPSGDFSGGGNGMPRFGRFGSDMYFGGQNPIGQNAIGKFIGGMFR